MSRFLRTLVLVLLCAALAAGGLWLWRSPDAWYEVQERLSAGHYWEFDSLMAAAGKRYGVDPMLIKAIAWRESRFDPNKVGSKGERGLMQLTDAAARDWAKAEKLETFMPTDLFDPKTNLEAGSWYVAKALERWKAKEDPIPFALADYNAGRRRVDQWISRGEQGHWTTAADLMQTMDFPTTRQYIEGVNARYRFYQRRGRM